MTQTAVLFSDHQYPQDHDEFIVEISQFDEFDDEDSCEPGADDLSDQRVLH